MLPPFLDTGICTGYVLVDGVQQALESFQWTPTGVLRTGGVTSSETRMLFEGNGVLQRLTVASPTPVTVTAALSAAFTCVPSMSWVTGQSGSVDGFTITAAAVPLSRWQRRPRPLHLQPPRTMALGLQNPWR